jgi:hypothetical protein
MEGYYLKSKQNGSENVGCHEIRYHIFSGVIMYPVTSAILQAYYKTAIAQGFCQECSSRAVPGRAKRRTQVYDDVFRWLLKLFGMFGMSEFKRGTPFLLFLIHLFLSVLRLLFRFILY